MLKKVLISLISGFYLIISPSVLQSYEGPPRSCTSLYTGYVRAVEFQDYTIASNDPSQKIEVEIKFDPQKTDYNIPYEVAITDGQFLGDTKRSGQVQVSSGATSHKFVVDAFEVPKDNLQVNLMTPNTGLAGSFGAGESLVCQLGTTKVYPDTQLLQANCPITMSNNIKSGEAFNININPSSLSSIKYTFYIYHTSALPPQINPGEFTLGTDNTTINPSLALFRQDIPSSNFIINYLNGGSQSSPALTNPNNNSAATPRLINGEYAALVVALDSSAKPPLYRYCHIKPFKVSGDNTSQPSTGAPIVNLNSPVRPGGLNAPNRAPDMAGVCPNTPSEAGGCMCTITLGPTQYLGLITAIGCVPTQPVGLVKALLTLSLAVGGSVAFLIIIMGVFQILTSAGNPDQLKNGSQILTNAIIGILFLIFSILILQIIGFGILNIPGFG